MHELLLKIQLKSLFMKPDFLIIFDKRNIQRAVSFCSSRGGDWSIICAFDVEPHELVLNNNIIFIKLFSIYKYQPSLVTYRVRNIIQKIYKYSTLFGVPVGEALLVEGVPLLKLKDNDLMEYTLHRLVFTLDKALEYLQINKIDIIWTLARKSERVLIPEWPNFDRLLNFDAFYAPLFANSVKNSSILVKYAGILTYFRACSLNATRECILMLFRIMKIVSRAIMWRHVNLPPDNGGKWLPIWVRSAAQVSETEEIVRDWNLRNDIIAFYLYDDSFKKSDCRKYLKEQKSLPSVAIYAYITPIILLKSIYLYIKFRFFDAGKIKHQDCSNHTHDPIEAVLLNDSSRTSLLLSLSESLFASSIVVRVMHSLHRDIQFPGMLVLNSYDLWGSHAGFVGRACHFKTVSLQNFNSDPWAYPTPCDKYNLHICFDEFERTRLVNIGADPDRIIALGSLSFSRLRRMANTKNTMSARNKLDIKDETILIVVGTQSSTEDASNQNSHLIDLVMKITELFSDVQCIVKLHPYERMTDYKRFIEKINNTNSPVRFVNNNSIIDVISACDIYISRFSTTLLTSIMLKKPTLSFLREQEFRQSCESVGFLSTGIIKSTDSFETAKKWVIDLIEQRSYTIIIANQELKLKRIYGTFDEHAFKRIQRAVEKIIF